MNNTSTKISVYISSHNYGKYLQEAINSVLRQSVGGWELILINDNSFDNTQDIMDLYRGDPRVSIITTNGIGLPAVANLALRVSKGQYLIRLDADDVFDENILLVLSNRLDREPDVALVFPDYFLVDETGGFIIYEGRGALHKSNHMFDIPANGACTMIRREVLEKIGGYREDLGAQDGLDLWTKVIKEYKCANVNLPLFYYRRHGDNLTENSMRILSARRAIKKDAIAAKLEQFRPIIAVIPCRKNYDFSPDLWNQKIHDASLLELALKSCTSSPIFDHIVVTSDNQDVRETMQKFSDPRLRFIGRNFEHTIPSCSIVSSLDPIARTLDERRSGVTVLSYIQSPFINRHILEEAVHTLIMNDADSAFAVQEIHEPLLKRTPNGLVPINHSSGIRTDFDTIYLQARTASATRNSNLKTGSLAGSKIVNFVVPKDESFFIETKKDLEIARLLSVK